MNRLNCINQDNRIRIRCLVNVKVQQAWMNVNGVDYFNMNDFNGTSTLWIYIKRNYNFAPFDVTKFHARHNHQAYALPCT